MIYFKKVQYLLIPLVIGFLTGLCCSSFNFLITLVTTLRKSFSIWPFILLPIAGYIVVLIYEKYGQIEQHGNNLILKELHQPHKKLRKRLIPLIFFSSITSHLFGASVGREGVAVQMGAGIADQFHSVMLNRKILLMVGMSAGFAAIFKAPLAGTIFGIEVLVVGTIEYIAFVPCLVAALAGYFTSVYFSSANTLKYPINFPHLNLYVLFLVFVLGIYYGIIARLFLYVIHKSKTFFSKSIKSKQLQAFAGGVLLLIFFLLFKSDRYFGISEELISDSFTGISKSYDFLGKILTTAISIGSGFKGGEVMPLFIVGATSGSFISQFVPISKSLIISLGFICVFAGASNTPIASLLLAMELFGIDIGLFAIIAIFASFLFSGKRGLYSAQKTHKKKFYFRSHIRKIFN